MACHWSASTGHVDRQQGSQDVLVGSAGGDEMYTVVESAVVCYILHMQTCSRLAVKV